MAAESKYLGVNRYVDLVMKGGVTSGVVYPRALTAFAEAFAFKNIAGTSAGAIAAAMAAAAEYRRRHGCGAGFEALDALPSELAEPGAMLQLFRPDRETKSLHRVLLAAIPKDGKLSKLRLAGAAFRAFPITTVLGLVPGLLLVGSALGTMSLEGMSLLPAGGAVLGIAVAIGGAVIALGFRLKARVRMLVDNGFGLCSGTADAPDDEKLSLSHWLHEKIQSVANKNGDEPLTFGDLWDAPPPNKELDEIAPGSKGINLEVITTCLTHGRPYRVPFAENAWKTFFFDADEMRRILPGEVVDWMERRARTPGQATISRDGRELLGLPASKDLPVVLGIRMSLSFPTLISAVGLWGVNYGLPETKRSAPGQRVADRCWFSDGGISSNFPIHFFDGVLPRWPTFGISLSPFPPGKNKDGSSERANIFFPESHRQGVQESWRTVSREEGLFGFFGSIVGAMQNWYDNSFLRMPGYRGRVVQIFQDRDEGGLNLEMDSQTIDRLVERGQLAGETLREAFTTPASEDHVMSWADHRWIRLRTGMNALRALLDRIETGLEHDMPADLSFEELLARGEGEPPSSYKASNAWMKRARAAVGELRSLMAEWDDDPFDDPPRPVVGFGITPEL